MTKRTNNKDNDDTTPSGHSPTQETQFVRVRYDFLDFLDENDRECMMHFLFTPSTSSPQKHYENDHDKRDNVDDLIRPNDAPNETQTTTEEANNEDAFSPNIGTEETNSNNSNKLVTAAPGNLDLAHLFPADLATYANWTQDDATNACNSGLQDYDEQIHWYGTQQDYCKWNNYCKTDKQCIDHMIRQRFDTAWDMWDDWIGIHL
jgi:hypothetical protein